MLADDVILYGDAGGMSPSWPRPIVGRDRVSRLMGGMAAWVTRHELHLERHEVNGQPGATLLDRDGRIVNVFALDIADGVIQTIRSVLNPDKLRHLGPVADVEGMLRAIRDERKAGS
ncbi:MAG TPA: hypothetical protein VFJ78_05125 [Gaiellaceae bacterium]|nr:hypothetical protein [Gaiellaceae bacterium]